MVHIADIADIADKMRYIESIESYLNMGNVVAGLS